MLRIQGDSTNNGRRGFLQIGALGVLGLTLTDLLTLRKAQAVESRADTAVILFWMAGGPSHLDTFDLKPDAPAEVRGPFRAMQTEVNGLRICELMPRLSRQSKRLAVLRSIAHSHYVHDDASHWVQTGYPLLNARQRGQLYPAQGSVVSHLAGSRRAGLPPYVCIPEAYSSPRGFYQRSAFLGGRTDPVNAGGDPKLGNYRRPDLSLPADLLMPRLESRRELLALLDRTARDADRHADTLDGVRSEAFSLLTGRRAREAFDLSSEPAKLRERYGRHAYGQSALLARRLVEAGVTFVTINLYEADVDWWDDHYDIEKNLRKRLPLFDQAVGSLLDDLHDRGQADRVLVAAFGEFGRGPKIDKLAGRSHWAPAMSAVLSGGGIKGGQVIGATTSDGSQVKERRLGPGDLLASIYRVLGIAHDRTVKDREGRPVPLVERGEVVRELF